eukprot:229573-Chlamydomonas_euryale.AAC.5
MPRRSSATQSYCRTRCRRAGGQRKSISLCAEGVADESIGDAFVVLCKRILGAIFIGTIPGDLGRSTQIPRPPISIGVDRTLGTVGEVSTPPGAAFEMVPGVPRCSSGKSPAPG